MDAWDRLFEDPNRGLTRAADSVQSALTKLGIVGADKARSARPAPPVWLEPDILEFQVVTEGIVRRLVFGVPDLTVRDGWRTDDPRSTDVDQTADFDEDLDVPERLLQADGLGRLYGGCYSLMVTDGTKDLSKPLDLSRPHEVVQIHPFTIQEVVAQGWDSDPKSKTWSKPNMFYVRAARPGFSQDFGLVHRSHLLYMPGLPVSPVANSAMPIQIGYDVSAAQCYWETVRDLGLARRSAALALMEQSMVVLSVPGGADLLAGSAEDAAISALELWGLTRSTRGTSLVTGNTTASRLEAPLSGLAEGVRVQYEQLGTVEGIPITVIMTSPPGGLSGDDVASRRQIQAFIDGRRRRNYNPWLKGLYRVQFGPGRRKFVWTDADPLTPLERATRSATLAARDVSLIAANVITLAESRARFKPAEEVELPVIEEDLTDDLDTGGDG